MAGTNKTNQAYKSTRQLKPNTGRLARYLLLICFPVFSLFLFSTEGNAQSNNYEFIPAPDLWYNDVDGIRLGVRVQGRVPGTFEDGPHRLNGGLWLGLWFPDLPVSYYLDYTEPIPGWSDFGSEASVQAISSVRTGYHNHGLGFNKRWQQSFDERKYREFSFRTSWQKRFDHEYVPFPVLWSDHDKLLTTTSVQFRDENSAGWYSGTISGSFQWLNSSYQMIFAEAIQQIPFNEKWGFRLKGFAGAASEQTAPEYLFSRSLAPAQNWMTHGFTRAKGTIPQPWMESGNIQVSGGANLRGYTEFDVESFTDEEQSPFLLHSIGGVNVEFDYPNPVGRAFRKIPYAAEFLSFRSYLFYDAGTSLGVVSNETDQIFADAGAGFSLSLNIPDYLGKSRGFVLRYDIPFWLSEPGTGDSLQFRNVFAFGAVISF